MVIADGHDWGKSSVQGERVTVGERLDDKNRHRGQSCRRCLFFDLTVDLVERLAAGEFVDQFI